MKTKEEAIKDLLEVVKYLRYSVKKASADGELEIGILSVKPDGSGKVESRFRANEFIEDIATVIDAPAYTEEDELEAKALELLQKMGI
jgi:hypothetical protein